MKKVLSNLTKHTRADKLSRLVLIRFRFKSTPPFLDERKINVRVQMESGMGNDSPHNRRKNTDWNIKKSLM